jgi:cytosine/adenosine deaminase-related metal-dependent hydrolase
LEILENAFRNIGLRGCLCYEVSDREGMEISQKGILENARFLEKCRVRNRVIPDPQIQSLFGLHASFTLSNATLERVRSCSAHLPCGFHIHLAEDRCDVEDSLRKYRCTIAER